MKIENIIEKHGVNKEGEDYFIGDIHGTFHILKDALKSIGFNKEKDRLFCCGDLIDRGSQEKQILDFLGQDWFFSCMGNHDHMLLEKYDIVKNHYANHKDDYLHIKKILTAKGYSFLQDLSAEDFEKLILLLKDMPLMREIETKDNRKIGCVHAEIPLGKTWNETALFLQDKTKQTNAYNEYMFWAERGQQVPPGFDTFYEHLFTFEPVAKTTKEKIERTASDLDLLFLGHNITPLKESPDINFKKDFFEKLKTVPEHIKFIDHGAFIAEQLETDVCGTVVYNNKGEIQVIIDSIPL